MATYIVGDIQGCYASLRALLRVVNFTKQDSLWCVGDLVNRGPDSLATLRFASDLGTRFVTVLGNHDLHFLAMVYGGHPHRSGDTMQELLSAPDCLELAEWLRAQPLLVEDEAHVLAHAGIPHIWTIDMARANARELETTMRGSAHGAFFRRMYGNEPSRWDDELTGMDRHRVIANYFTRMRLVAVDGRMEFAHKGALSDLPSGYRPWFDYPSRIEGRIYFGHWAALDGHTGSTRLIGLDTGCVWGRTLTAVRVEDGRLFAIEAADRDRPPTVSPNTGATDLP